MERTGATRRQLRICFLLQATAELQAGKSKNRADPLDHFYFSSVGTYTDRTTSALTPTIFPLCSGTESKTTSARSGVGWCRGGGQGGGEETIAEALLCFNSGFETVACRRWPRLLQRMPTSSAEKTTSTSSSSSGMLPVCIHVAVFVLIYTYHTLYIFARISSVGYG